MKYEINNTMMKIKLMVYPGYKMINKVMSVLSVEYEELFDNICLYYDIEDYDILYNFLIEDIEFFNGFENNARKLLNEHQTDFYKCNGQGIKRISRFDVFKVINMINNRVSIKQ